MSNVAVARHRYRWLLYLFIAALSASVIPLVRGDMVENPVYAVSTTWRFLKYHGLHVLVLTLWGAAVASFAYSAARSHYPGFFPTSPFLEYPLLALLSAALAKWLEDQTDSSHEYSWYAREASYIGCVVVGYAAFGISAYKGRRAGGIRFRETREQRTLADLEAEAARRRHRLEAEYYHDRERLGPLRVGDRVLLTWSDGAKEEGTIRTLYPIPNRSNSTIGALVELANGQCIDIDSVTVKIEPMNPTSESVSAT